MDRSPSGESIAAGPQARSQGQGALKPGPITVAEEVVRGVADPGDVWKTGPVQPQEPPPTVLPGAPAASGTTPRPGACSVCGGGPRPGATKLHMCARCLQAGPRYCSQECQKADWRAHKAACGVTQDPSRRSGSSDGGGQCGSGSRHSRSSGAASAAAADQAPRAEAMELFQWLGPDADGVVSEAQFALMCREMRLEADDSLVASAIAFAHDLAASGKGRPPCGAGAGRGAASQGLTWEAFLAVATCVMGGFADE